MQKSGLNRRSSGKSPVAFPAPQKNVREIRLTADDCDPIFTVNQFFGDRKFIPHGNAPILMGKRETGRGVLFLAQFRNLRTNSAHDVTSSFGSGRFNTTHIRAYPRALAATIS